MKIIKPSFEIYNIPDAIDHDAVLMHIEKIGRTCYKSEDRITPTSCIKFIQNIRDRKHWAVLEHYIFTVSVSPWVYYDIQKAMEDATLNKDADAANKLKFINTTHWAAASNSKYEHLVSFSATTLNNLYECETFKYDDIPGIAYLIRFMRRHYPELITPNKTDNSDDYDPHIEFLSREEIKSLPDWLRKVHDFMSVKFTVDRGVTHEIVRHRPASYAQESTRYCNYSQGKFGNEITVILPSFFDTGMGTMSNSFVYDTWKHACETAERDYFSLLEMGATPQEARSVLPNSLKTDLNMTASLSEFNHFFNVRCDKAAHPQMREVACPLLVEANNVNDYYKGMFNNAMKLFYKEEN